MRDHRLDRLLLRVAQLNAGFRERRGVLHRVVQGLPHEHRRRLHVLPHRDREVERRPRRLVEDVVPGPRSVADIRERGDEVRPRLDRLVVDPRLLHQRRGQGADLLGGHVRDPARRLQDGVRLSSDELTLLELVESDLRPDRERAAERRSCDLRALADLVAEAGRLLRGVAKCLRERRGVADHFDGQRLAHLRRHLGVRDPPGTVADFTHAAASG